MNAVPCCDRLPAPARRLVEAACLDGDFWWACGRKASHRDPGAAVAIARIMTRKKGTAYEHYPCPFCGGYHVGRERREE